MQALLIIITSSYYSLRTLYDNIPDLNLKKYKRPSNWEDAYGKLYEYLVRMNGEEVDTGKEWKLYKRIHGEDDAEEEEPDEGDYGDDFDEDI